MVIKARYSESTVIFDDKIVFTPKVVIVSIRRYWKIHSHNGKQIDREFSILRWLVLDAAMVIEMWRCFQRPAMQRRTSFTDLSSLVPSRWAWHPAIPIMELLGCWGSIIDHAIFALWALQWQRNPEHRRTINNKLIEREGPTHETWRGCRFISTESYQRASY